jgi:hypothetical protein
LKGGDPVPGADGWSEAKAAAKAALKAGKTAAEATTDGIVAGLKALETAGQYTYKALCAASAVPGLRNSDLVGGTTSVVLATRVAAQQAATAAIATTGVGLTVTAALNVACTAFPPESNSDDDPASEGGKALPTPVPTPKVTATPTLRPFDSDRDCYRYVPPVGGIGARCFNFKDGQLVVTFPDSD